MTTALLVIDVQTGLCTGPYAAFEIDAVIERINALAAKARAAGVPVIYVQHEEDDEPLRFGTEDWQLDRRLSVQTNDARVRKTAPDSFFKTELGPLLQGQRIRHLVVCGLQTDFCVDTTVRRALSSGYHVTLAADAHSTMDNGVLTAAQIIAHHNRTLSHLTSYGVRMAAVPAAEIEFSRE